MVCTAVSGMDSWVGEKEKERKKERKREYKRALKCTRGKKKMEKSMTQQPCESRGHGA